MALTKLPAGSIIDGTITSAKIANATILGEDIGTGSISADKINTTLDISSHTITLPQDLIGHRELDITFTSPADDDKFLQISSAGVLQWSAPGTYPITYAALSGVIPAGHIANETITSAHIENLTIADEDIADGTISGVKLNATLDLSTKTITYPTDNSLTNLTITGDLHITGTTTEIDTQNLLVKDNIIVINDEESGVGVTAGAAGIEIHRGPGQDKATIMWNETSDKFEFKVGAQDAILVFDNVEPPDSSVGYDQVKINNLSDPGPGVNTFLESDGTGNFNLTEIQIGGITLDGSVTGPVDNNTLANYSVTSDHLQDFSVTSSKIDTTLSFVGKTIILNPADILSAINGAGYFNVSNPNFNVPDDCIDAAKIVDGSVTGFKLANTLNLASKTIQWPALQIFNHVQIDDYLTVNNITVINNTLSVTDKVTFTNQGGDDALTINNSSSANILKLQNNSVDVFVVDNSGDVSIKQNLIIDKILLEKSGTVIVNGTIATINLALGGHFVLELDGLTGDITELAISNIDLTPGVVTSFMLKVVQGPVDRTIAWSGISYIKWPDAMGDGSLSGLDAPIISSGNDKEDLFKFTTYDNGGSWYGQILGMDYSAPGPTVTVVTTTIPNTGNAVVQSNATGTAYLINTSVTPLYLESHITGAADNLWNSVAISSPNTNTNLAATGLIDGTYKAYSVNNAGTLSIPSINSVTLDTSAPIASATTSVITSSGIAVVQSTETGTVYLVNTAVTVTTLGSITGAANDQWNNVTIITANTDTNLAATGLADGTYNAYAMDELGNFSSTPSANSITIGAMAATGGTETTYGNYKVHTFTADGTFTVTDNTGVIDVIVVAGGGGGTGSGGTDGGGGGAGGVVVATGKSLGTQAYAITIGDGGTGVYNNPCNGNGDDSTFADIITKGGGGSGGYQNYSACTGGSGGGCPGKGPYAGDTNQLTSGSQGGGTGYGNVGGGNTTQFNVYCAGSGGGAGTKGYAAEVDGPNTSHGDNASPGGDGIENLFQTGSNQWYAGGGASGHTGGSITFESGGAGGGGNTLANGTANTGGGGGGGNTTTGGSGIVIIRYMFQ